MFVRFHTVYTHPACRCVGRTRLAPAALEAVPLAAVWCLPSWREGETVTWHETTFPPIRCVTRKEYGISSRKQRSAASWLRMGLRQPLQLSGLLFSQV